jgi:hypothetical protein
MAKPMFFYAGVYDSAVDAELDHEATRALSSAHAVA